MWAAATVSVNETERWARLRVCAAHTVASRRQRHCATRHRNTHLFTPLLEVAQALHRALRREEASERAALANATHPKPPCVVVRKAQRPALLGGQRELRHKPAEAAVHGGQSARVSDEPDAQRGEHRWWAGRRKAHLSSETSRERSADSSVLSAEGRSPMLADGRRSDGRSTSSACDSPGA